MRLTAQGVACCAPTDPDNHHDNHVAPYGAGRSMLRPYRNPIGYPVAPYGAGRSMLRPYGTPHLPLAPHPKRTPTPTFVPSGA